MTYDDNNDSDDNDDDNDDDDDIYAMAKDEGTFETVLWVVNKGQSQ